MSSPTEAAPQASQAEERLVARFLAVADAANADANLVRRGRHLTTDFIVRIGSTACFVTVHAGRIEGIERRPQIMRQSSFTISAEPADWEAFWEPCPRPGWHDVFAMMKRGRARLEGDIHTLMCHLQYIKNLIALPRAGQEVR